ncbi:MAG TPA: AAA domain-containing protein [Cytophagales bacterium]|nr:AAA domain-containing protein [Cytophagales bacterium]
MDSAKEELQQLRKLLKIEKEEDLQQYKSQVLNASLQDRVQSGLTWYPIKINQTGIAYGEQLFIDLEKTTQLESSGQLQSGKRAILFSNYNNDPKNHQIEGIIVSATAQKMRFVTYEEDLPDWAKFGKLGVDLLFDESSYREMEETLKLVMDASGRSAELRDILLGYRTARFEESHHHYNSSNLNGSQNQAVRNILNAKDVAIVHGPPGTGKTTTFVQAIKEVVKQEKQTLVAAPSNTAVDLLVEKLLQEGLNVVRIGHPSRVNDDLISHTMDAQVANHEYYADIKDLKKKAEEFRNLAFKYKRNFGKSEAQQRRALLDEAKALRNEASKLEDYIQSDVLSRAQIIACTLVGTNNYVLKDKVFKTVFIDEAAQALEPACWIPVLKAQRVVMAGDHFQLPPTVKSYEAGKQGLNVTLFEKTIQRQKADVMLEEQYRMNEQIMAFSAAQFYKGKLHAHTSNKNVYVAASPEPVTFIDTAGCSFDEKSAGIQSLINEEEGRLLLKYLDDLITHIEYDGTEKVGEQINIGIISPYRGQVQFLKEHMLAYENISKYLQFIDIHSIDGFQGQERDVILISLVRSNDKGEVGFLADTRRMNVALTRAKRKLVVFGDSATLAAHPFYDEFLDFAQKNDFHKTAWEFI